MSAAALALRPPPGFAAQLLSDTIVVGWVFVVRPGAEPFGWGLSDGDCLSPGAGLPRKDWPLTGQYLLHRGYALSEEKKRTAMLLVGGVDPIYATREESTHFRAEPCGTSFGLSLGPKESRQLFAEMLGTSPEEFPWQIRPQIDIEFRSLRQFHGDLLAFVGKEQTKYRVTVAALLAHNLITASEAQQCLPELRLQISDMRREEDAVPILKPSNLPAHVEWPASPF